LLTLTVGFKFSWISLAAAVVIQMLVMAALVNKDRREKR
jgi:hypothetical protein